ncbi:MAG: V-type ATP synthase subunit F [Candidatus Aenigmarchaeota archaeon]|nr:V-type ATP synthase subunit F [Candidatus Aenigmarchaeota archaeon]
MTETNPMFNIAVVGDEQFTLGFHLAGVRKVINAKNNEIHAKIEGALSDKQTGVLVLKQNDVDTLPLRFQEKLRNSTTPVVVAISTDNSGAEVLRALVKRAIGVDVWEKK